MTIHSFLKHKKYEPINGKMMIRPILLCTALCLSPLGQAQDEVHQADKPASNPSKASIHRNNATGEVKLDLTIQKIQGKIFNPGTNTFDQVSLRSYQSGTEKSGSPFVGPTIHIKPGDTVRVKMSNKLDPNKKIYNQDVNTPHNFNSTNLHSHGLWISPSGNSDNVLIKIDPGVDFTYEWNIPADHPAGTFWYHPHLHGSTALQVSSGMAGALIINGDRLPSADTNGDIDTLLKNDDGTAFTERLAVLGQIQYACRDEDGNIKIAVDGDIKDKNGKIIGPWFCDKGDIGTIEKYDQFGPGRWRNSTRYTTINGHILPTFPSIVGNIERWRFVHAGVIETTKPSFYKIPKDMMPVPSASEFAKASTAEKGGFIEKYCSGPQVTQLSMAMDGLTRDRLVAQKHTILQPGYREDLLMTFPEEGLYCIVDDATLTGNVNGAVGTKKILGFINASPSKTGDKINDVVEHIKQNLITSAEKSMPEDIKRTIIDNLQGLKLTRFVDHKTIADSEVTGYQTLAFNISSGDNPLSFDVGELDEKGNPKNLSPYKPGRIDRNLVLGDVEEWTLKSFSNKKSHKQDGHPYHIHVNPFQVVSIKDKDGKEVSGYETNNESPYANLQGVWKDTLFIDADGYTITTRTRYQRYIGEFVLHCHILDHEDQGMMQNVKISLPDANGKPTSAHSSH